MAPGQASLGGAQHERHVGVSRRRDVEQAMQQGLAWYRVQEVRPPHHLAHTLGGAVHNDGELVGRGAIVAAHDEVVRLPLVMPEQPILETYALVLRPHAQRVRTARSFAVSSRQVPAG